MKILIIGNPIASGGHAAEKIKALTRILNARGHQVEPCLTRYAGHGKSRVAALENDIDRIIAVGGDGTLNEIVSGMVQSRCVPLLQLPSGNANLLARDLGLPRTVSETAILVESGRIIMADLGFMNEKPFVMVAGAGFDARVTEALKSRRKGRVTNLSYVLPMLTAFRAGQQKFNVKVDNQVSVSGAMVLVSNVKNYAGLFDMAFDADIASGSLDVILLPKASPLFLAQCLAAGVLSRITRIPGVVYLKGRDVTITESSPIPVQIDGDFAGWHDRVSIRMEPARIPIIGREPGTGNGH
ncbi:MAG: diacylglycerol kinase family protein [Pseudomonadota bacterium]